MVYHDPFGARDQLSVGGRKYTYFRLSALEEKGVGPVSKLPFSIKILLEAVLRQIDNKAIGVDHVRALANWNAAAPQKDDVPFKPARILLQDFTGVPAVVDLAALRSAMHRLGGDPKRINPLIPVDLVIDHSVQVDAFGSPEALEFNISREFERNEERYKFLRWAQKSFDNFRVVPPGTGIVHQVNLEYLAKVVQSKQVGDEVVVFPDSLVGTDSHTTMINGIGVLGWGVGGIEAEACMLGQPLYQLLPEVIGFKLTGSLPEGATATDLALTVTNMLRKKGVVGKFVEFYGPGLTNISLADRATVANMAPEYGATMGFFPVDAETLNYLRSTGRDEELVALVEAYTKAEGLFRTDDTPDPVFTDTIELDLATVQPTMAGPKRPQDRIALTDMKKNFEEALTKPLDKAGFGLTDEEVKKEVVIQHKDGSTSVMKTGAVAIAAITSCTNTSNPSVMLGAGLLAKKAVERGLVTPKYVKTSLAPGSKVVKDYLERAGLIEPLAALGFDIVGYGCTTCIGNSGPLPDEVSEPIKENDLLVSAVLSGNRNFEGRIHALVRANYLASPPLVIAYALAGTVDIDLTTEPLGTDKNGQPVYLKDIWPSSIEIEQTIQSVISPEMFRAEYEHVFSSNERWNQLATPEGELYDWDKASTYIQEPPFFVGLTSELPPASDIKNGRVLALLGDSVTTDHISPAGNIAINSPAGKYLTEHGVKPFDFNSYGSRRGNHEVMMRGTFANIRIRNQVAPGTEGGVTKYLPTDEVMPIYDAAMKYQEAGVPLVVIAGKEYGTGSSRDWAAKGTNLLGIRAVIAESFERIHRSNLVGMGVLPLQFKNGDSWQSLGLTGREVIQIEGLDGELVPGQDLKVTFVREDGSRIEVQTTVRLDSNIEIEYYRNGGILQTVLRSFLQEELARA
ncbi:aconitate hydratase AcnA [Alicyclobacillus cycloheptanicus]|uniref:aconitate hydratase AcnA n=1 Tax=Alicyclobacillus cycloheptanicus TaxID=1457 RepID=UPI002377E815|nr:aconitate hydratase AcnA [Alicyclobacillus cycloheptanicus]WDM00047.1 aconitate hydratase AcnA [Alicyclobacillus cycloheptanicus]